MNAIAKTIDGARRPASPANAGVHVYRWRLEACLEGRSWIVSNDREGRLGVATAFKGAGVRLVAIDVIGGFERGLVQTLQECRVTVVAAKDAPHAREPYIPGMNLDS